VSGADGDGAGTLAEQLPDPGAEVGAEVARRESAAEVATWFASLDAPDRSLITTMVEGVGRAGPRAARLRGWLGGEEAGALLARGEALQAVTQGIDASRLGPRLSRKAQRQAAAAQLRHDGMPIEEIAPRVGVREETIRADIRRASRAAAEPGAPPAPDEVTGASLTPRERPGRR
jgi:hypothetical protein